MKPMMKKMRREAAKRTKINDRAFPRAWDDVFDNLISVPKATCPAISPPGDSDL